MVKTCCVWMCTNRGWNNNPNTLQFKYALRSCMLKNGIKPSKAANCQEQADELPFEPPEHNIIQCTDTSPNPSSTEEVSQFIKLIRDTGSFHNDVLFYIAGYMCRKLMSVLKCTICLSAVTVLASTCDLRDNKAARLTVRKDRGGLLASNDVFLIVKTADNVLRHFILTTPLASLRKKVILKVQIETCKSLAGSVFKELEQHFADTHDPTKDDHRVQMIKTVCQHFTVLVMRHNANIMTQRFARQNKGSLRHKLTKQILFLHQ
ncbi:hypothetical protein EGW08_022929 [Elysia chlorotica]|uniref:Uncharacterized protein n=1 Tax=Elysia chlorotica TaxID=188477 RepID=A0A433SJR4_ELYCH|nr:hypothetical protein EGW08_022929 [Elysia chlorotica]